MTINGETLIVKFDANRFQINTYPFSVILHNHKELHHVGQFVGSYTRSLLINSFIRYKCSMVLNKCHRESNFKL